jgi:hypothetical protein
MPGELIIHELIRDHRGRRRLRRVADVGALELDASFLEPLLDVWRALRGREVRALVGQRPEGPTLAKEGRREGGKPDCGMRRLAQEIALRDAALREVAARVGDKRLAVMSAKARRFVPAFRG